MPHMTGFDLALEIRKTRPHVPIIMCTGSSDKVRAKEAGIKDVIIKPLNTQKMDSAVRKVLDEKN